MHIKLTTPDGRAILVNMHHARTVIDLQTHRLIKSGRSSRMCAFEISVSETIDEILEKLRRTSQ